MIPERPEGSELRAPDDTRPSGQGPNGPGERRYRILMHAYPARMREEEGGRLLEVFRYHRSRHLQLSGRLGFAFWRFIVSDLLASSLRERRDPLDGRGRPPLRPDRAPGERMGDLLDDVRYSFRRLARSPGFTTTALTILALTIGANATAFGIVNALLLQPPPFQDPDRIVDVMQHADGGDPGSTSFPAYQDVARSQGVFEVVAASYVAQGFLQRGDALDPLLVEYATASYLDVLGLAPTRGAWFDTTHDDPNGPPAAVVTFATWTERLDADPEVLGSTLRINGGAVTVVGVGPREFNGGRGPAAVDVWLSISAMATTGGRVASLQRRQDHPMSVRARLSDGVSVEQAASAMDRLAADLARDYPEINANRGITVLSVLDNRVSPATDSAMKRAAALAMATVLGVLLVGALNLANLMLVRGTARSAELAVRRALGAGRARLMRTVLVEALILVVVGGVAGLTLAYLAVQAMGSARVDVLAPILVDVRLDGRVAAFTATLIVGSGLIVGLLPALQASRREVQPSLRSHRAGTIGARRRFGLTGGLVAGQITASLLLLAVCGVFVESLVRATAAHPGFDAEGRIFLEINSGPLDLDRAATVPLHDRIEEGLESLPRVQEVTRAYALPAAQYGTTTLLLGSALDGVERPAEIPWNLVTRDYFDVLGIPVLFGRVPDADDPLARQVAVVSESFALTYWGRSDVVGEQYRSESDPDMPVDISAVVGDATVRSLGEAPTPSLYWPYDAGTERLHFILRTDSESPADLLRSARAVVESVDGGVMVPRVGTLEEHLGDTLERQRLVGVLLGGLGTLALLMAVLGVYGVVADSVNRRRGEVGVRIALGAARERVVGFFVRDVSFVVVAGALLGVLVAVPLSAVVGRLFTGAQPSPLTTLSAAAVLLLAALLATVIPALRAARTDPADALRRE